jgi:hypothetical protein
MSARQAFARWREDRRKRRGEQDTSVGESEEQAAERAQGAERTRRELNAAEDAEREQAGNVQGNELY